MSEGGWATEDDDDNMILKKKEPIFREAFLDDLEDKTSNIEEIIKYHLRLGQQQECTIFPRADWIYGSFNVCIPAFVSSTQQRLIFRCPFPFMLRPSSKFYKDEFLAEKIKCEAATYAWISENCKSVPIPVLWGVGLPNGLRLTPVTKASLVVRAVEYCKDIWARIFGQRRFVPFIPHMMAPSLRSGYLLISAVEQGVMLSKMGRPAQPKHKSNLYLGLTRVMLDMARHPLPLIGSFTVQDNGAITLSNRPLTKHLPLLERQGIPTAVSLHSTYSRSDTYFDDLISCLDLKLMHQPNAIRDRFDANAQMACLWSLSGIKKHFILENVRNGPFVMTFTDLHDSNIFVDMEYNITSIVDLEWCCSLPLETLHPPFWLTGCAVDDFGDEADKRILDEEWKYFINLLEQEENRVNLAPRLGISTIMKECLQYSIPWYLAALMEPRATYNLFLNHIQPIFTRVPTDDYQDAVDFERIGAYYWTRDKENFVKQKLKDREMYKQAAHRSVMAVSCRS